MFSKDYLRDHGGAYYSEIWPALWQPRNDQESYVGPIINPYTKKSATGFLDVFVDYRINPPPAPRPGVEYMPSTPAPANIELDVYEP